MEQPFDMFYSIAFERFELGSSRFRVGFETYQIPYQRKYLFELDLSKSKWFEYGSKHMQITIPDGGVHEVHEFHRSLGSPFTRFTFHLEHSENH